jgi:hypothetical protein
VRAPFTLSFGRWFLAGLFWGGFVRLSLGGLRLWHVLLSLHRGWGQGAERGGRSRPRGSCPFTLLLMDFGCFGVVFFELAGVTPFTATLLVHATPWKVWWSG